MGLEAKLSPKKVNYFRIEKTAIPFKSRCQNFTLLQETKILIGKHMQMQVILAILTIQLSTNLFKMKQILNSLFTIDWKTFDAMVEIAKLLKELCQSLTKLSKKCKLKKKEKLLKKEQ